MASKLAGFAPLPDLNSGSKLEVEGLGPLGGLPIAPNPTLYGESRDSVSWGPWPGVPRTLSH